MNNDGCIREWEQGGSFYAGCVLEEVGKEEKEEIRRTPEYAVLEHLLERI